MNNVTFNGHIHVHSEYSPLDGLAKIEELILKAQGLGQSFIAITDHGSSSGLYDAAKLSKKHNFDVILGEEFYYDSGSELKIGHLILLAKDEEGLRNIFRLQKSAYDNFYYKPRLNLDMLKEHSAGLICTTACIANQIGQYILKGENHLAVNHILELRNIFGEDFYIELQSSTVDDVIKVNKVLADISISYNIPAIITNDVHYVDKEDYSVHEVLLCIQQKGKMDSPKRWKFEKNDYWLKSEEELLEPLDYLDAEFIENAFIHLDEIHSKCKRLELEKGNYLPHYNGMSKDEEDTELANLTISKYNRRIAERNEKNPEFFHDLAKELNVISETGYSGYFLIVQEYANWARQNNILVGDGRGSGAGSKVAYTIGITEINPQRYDLLFERFLSVGREPDFDIDFSDIDSVYTHLQQVYGRDNVARVGAFARFTCKSAIRKVMGVYGFSQSEIAVVCTLLPRRLSFSLQEALDESSELVNWFSKHENILHIVTKIEGIMEHLSTHAGGVIICDNLTELLPVLTDSDNREKLIVALSKEEIEELGHYKFDILGLNSLTMMQNIIEYTGNIDWTKVDFEDKNVYDMMCKGDTLGIFQLSDQTDKVVEQQPQCFEDLIAINALIRPGVGDWNDYIKRRERKDTEDIKQRYLKSTSGIIVYQEQYLLLAGDYAGWDIAYSDKNIRKNKNILCDAELKEKFYHDSYERGYEDEDIEKTWNDICAVVAGGYGFNRSHSCSYAVLSYQTAYMKHYCPKEFYSAYLTQNFDDAEKITEVINLLRTKEIHILPPDINKSIDKFIPCEEGILFPLTSIRGVGGSVWYEINRLKPIESLEDFLNRRTKKFVKSTSIINLIKAGAFDFESRPRYELLEQFKEGNTEMPNYIYEKEAFDFYLSSSPFDKYLIKPFKEYSQGDNVSTIVETTTVAVKYDKNGGEMAFITGSNSTDTIKIIIFSSVWKNYKCDAGDLILIKGRKDKGSLLVNSIEHLEAA